MPWSLRPRVPTDSGGCHADAPEPREVAPRQGRLVLTYHGCTYHGCAVPYHGSYLPGTIAIYLLWLCTCCAKVDLLFPHAPMLGGVEPCAAANRWGKEAQAAGEAAAGGGGSGGGGSGGGGAGVDGDVGAICQNRNLMPDPVILSMRILMMVNVYLLWAGACRPCTIQRWGIGRRCQQDPEQLNTLRRLALSLLTTSVLGL